MSTRLSSDPEPPLHFLDRKDTKEALEEADDALTGLNDDYSMLSQDKNSRLLSAPYEGALLFTLDSPSSTYASGILHKPAYGLEQSERLDFVNETAAHHRVMLSQTALGAALKEDRKEPSFRSSRMNPSHQTVWAHPLVAHDRHGKEELVGAIQLAATINDQPDWSQFGNDEVAMIWKSHHRTFERVARSLSALAQKAPSLSRSLEIAPPVTPNAYVIQWDVRNSTRTALSDNYPAFDAYLEAWKIQREKLTEELGVRILDRGEGEFIIVPLDERLNLNDPKIVSRFGRDTVEPLVQNLLTAHHRVADAFRPTLFPHIYMGVGLGAIEDDKNNNPTGQVLWDIARTTSINSGSVISYTDSAKKALGKEN